MALAVATPSYEIVAVDSMQVYRGMDIGTAKPTPDDRARVPHHCLDLVEPAETFTVAEFAAHGGVALRAIDARGHRPLLVAGTGLYLRGLTDPMAIPGRWPAVRAELDALVAVDGSIPLHRRLVELDPVAAAKMEPTNARRVVRALEVVLGSGRPFSSFGPGISSFPPTPFDMIGLEWDRPRLAARIEARVQRMLGNGLLDEVRKLADAPAGLSRTARQALGYRELLAHLDDVVGLDEAVDLIITRTRQFAVRQTRWFRRDPRVRWITINDDPVTDVVPQLS